MPTTFFRDRFAFWGFSSGGVQSRGRMGRKRFSWGAGPVCRAWWSRRAGMVSPAACMISSSGFEQLRHREATETMPRLCSVHGVASEYPHRRQGKFVMTLGYPPIHDTTRRGEKNKLHRWDF